jgi:hypothetical protein
VSRNSKANFLVHKKENKALTLVLQGKGENSVQIKRIL